jgi:hypothetical protein
MARERKRRSLFVVFVRRIILLSVLACFLWFGYIYAGRMLCGIAIRQIGELTATQMQTKSVVFNPRGSVTIENIIISPKAEEVGNKGGNKLNGSILEAEKVYAKFNLRSFFLLKPRIEVIDVNSFVFNARYDLDTGKSNLAGFKMQTTGGSLSNLPKIHLQDGRLQYSRITAGQEKIAASMPINIDFRTDSNQPLGYVFEITTSTLSSGFGISRLTGSWKPGDLIITGGFSTQDIPELEMACSVDVLAAWLKYENNSDFSLRLNLTDLQSKRNESLDKLAALVPASFEQSSMIKSLRNFFRHYQPKGRIDISLNAAGNLMKLEESTMKGVITCRDVAFRNTDKPYLIENLAGIIDFNMADVTMNKLRGKHGQTGLVIDGWSRSSAEDWQYDISVTSDKMPLDGDMYSALNSAEKEVWSSFEPNGFAGLNMRMSQLPQAGYKAELSLDLQNVDAVYSRFPYPLKNLNGPIKIGRDGIDFSNVISRQDNRIIILNGMLKTASNGNPVCDISIDVNNIPLDATLEKLLPEKQLNVYRQIRPSGLADGRIQIQTKDTNSSMDFTADLHLKDASLRPGSLSLPVTGVTTHAVITPDLINVRDLTGLYDGSPVSLKGVFATGSDKQIQYDLSFSGQRMKLNDELLKLIPQSLEKTVSQLKPDGRIDIIADIAQKNPAEAADYKVRLTCLDDIVIMPYLSKPLKDIKGSILIDANKVVFEDITASVENVSKPLQKNGSLTLAGRMNLSQNTLDDAMLSISVKDVLFDKNLANVLPGDIQGLYEQLSPGGSFGVDFNNITIQANQAGIERLDFDGKVSLQDCSLKIIDPNSELNAVIAAKGLYQADYGLTDIAAAIETGDLKILGKTFTGIRGDIRIDPNLKHWSSDSFIADCYGGKATGKFELVQPAEGPMEYILQVAYSSVDINDFLLAGSLKRNENGNNNHTGDIYTSGKMNGFISIAGQPSDNNSRTGTCNFTITDMKVGQLSLLGKLLNIINLSEQSDYVYNSLFVDSFIKGNKLVVRKVDLSGKSSAFYGSGLVDISGHNIDLSLIARGRRQATAEPSMIQSLTEGLGQAVVRVDITGKYDDPIIATRALPVIESTLNILGTRQQTQN